MDVSVVVPAYNAAQTVQDCLSALRTQRTSASYEVILVDDGSSDGTADLAEASDLSIIRHPQQRGAAAARNSGINAARGQIICFTDADCQPRHDWIESMLQALHDPEVVGAKGVYASTQKQLVARFVQHEYEDKYDLLRKQETINFIDTYSAAYRRQVLLANDGFDEQIFYVEDQELSFRLAARGYLMVFQPAAVVYHLHSATWRAYFRKKFMIGYWKAQILRRFPGRAVQDSHTPQVLKLQILLLAVAILSGAALLLTPWSGLLLAAAVILFLASSLPFLGKVWAKDRPIAVAGPLLLGVRAAALGFGYAWGLLRPQKDIANEYTIDGFNYLAKRTLDIMGALGGLTATALVAPFIALSIKLDSPGPVIFQQERIGEEGRPFTLYKFRSMCANAEAELAHVIDLSTLPEPVYKNREDPRLTRVGRFLRRWSLDELPQFWNVLIGDMSLVGPRPEETRFVALYDDWQRRRLAVKPGMTGPMQVNGRGDLSLNARLQLELEYIEQYSLWRDLDILARTIPAVLRGEGAH